MPGAVFIVCVPSETYEEELDRQTLKFRTSISTSTLSHKSLNNANEESPLLHGRNISDYASLGHSPDRKKCSCLYMQKVMDTILKQLNIKNAVWTRCLGDKYMQVTFTLQIDGVYEEILEILKDYHIGSKYNSSVSVIPCSVYYNQKHNDPIYNEVPEDDCAYTKLQSSYHSGWSKFLLSIRARLTVGQVVENIKNQAALTFDFICLLIIASTICAIGLVENNNVYLISSMLISPMMGPVMASTFGKVIRDRVLQRMGVINEVLGLALSTVIGFIYGTMICVSTDTYGEVGWPTIEMISRGEVHTIGVSCLVALLSGAAVALAVLSDNISSLVGVAISTSLMPPAVNAGLLWSLASVYYMKGNETTRYSSLTHTNYYFDNGALELTSLGAASLCLTFVNIVCIYVAGILVFKIKEVAPIASRDLIRRHFWEHDIKIARDYNKTLNGDDTKNIQEDLKNEYTDYRKDIFRKKFRGLVNGLHHSMDLPYGSDKIRVKTHQHTWSPCMLLEAKKPTMQEMSEIYNQVVRECDPIDIRCETPASTLVGSTVKSTKTHEENMQSTPENACVEQITKSQYKKERIFVVTPCVDPERYTFEPS